MILADFRASACESIEFRELGGSIAIDHRPVKRFAWATSATDWTTPKSPDRS
jgi:hypothetical protein